jgi:protein-S-isoprenylcysteine O-methyltransferase Ste14
MDWGRVAKRIRVPLGFLFAAFFLWRAQPRCWSLAAGSAVALTGVLIRAISSGHVKKNEELATTGPYAYTRNPLYFGSIVIASGFALASLRWEIAVALVIMFAAIYIPVIRGEEEFLSAHFADYSKYCTQVPRLLPRLSPCPSPKAAGSPEASHFSPELYRKHREYNALLGTLAVIVALIVKLLAKRIGMAH